MLTTRPSLAYLNHRMASKDELSMLHMRPNFVVDGAFAAWAEDEWREVRIGAHLRMTNVKPCTRCVFTTIDPATGERSDNGEPLNTLRRFAPKNAGASVFTASAWFLKQCANSGAMRRCLASTWRQIQSQILLYKSTSVMTCTCDDIDAQLSELADAISLTLAFVGLRRRPTSHTAQTTARAHCVTLWLAAGALTPTPRVAPVSVERLGRVRHELGQVGDGDDREGNSEQGVDNAEYLAPHGHRYQVAVANRREHGRREEQRRHERPLQLQA